MGPAQSGGQCEKAQGHVRGSPVGVRRPERFGDRRSRSFGRRSSIYPSGPELRLAPSRDLSRIPVGRRSHHFSAQGNAARGSKLSREQMTMRKEYDFASGRRNPYATRLKKQVTIRLDQEAIAYFKAVSSEVGIPYQSLINLYLRDCVAARR